MHDLREIDLSLLPQSLREIVEAAGLPAGVALVEAAGGTRVYVPERITAEHRLAQWLGSAAAERLVARFGGETLEVPRCLAAIRAARDQRIRRERSEGAAIAELALQYRLTERQIYNILAADAATEERQWSLL